MKTNFRSRLSEVLSEMPVLKLFGNSLAKYPWKRRITVGKIMGQLEKLHSECFVEIFNSFRNSFSVDNRHI